MTAMTRLAIAAVEDKDHPGSRPRKKGGNPPWVGITTRASWVAEPIAIWTESVHLVLRRVEDRHSAFRGVADDRDDTMPTKNSRTA